MEVYISYLLVVLGVMWQAGGWQLTLEVPIEKHNTIYEPHPGDPYHSNGNGSSFIVGVNAHGVRRRALIQFNVTSTYGFLTSNSYPISKIELHLSSRKTSGRAESVVGVYPILKAWGAAGSVADETPGRGVLPHKGDATWAHTFFNNSFWDNLGGDYNTSDLLASQAVSWFRVYSWSSPELIRCVNGWAAGQENLGWLLKGLNEHVNSSAVEFLVSDSKLAITYDGPVPQWFWITLTLSVVGLAVLIGFFGCICSSDDEHRYSTVRNVAALKNDVKIGSIITDAEVRKLKVSDIIFKDFVGHGKNSEVYRAELNSVIVAVKKIQLEDTSEDLGIEFGEEIKIMSLLAHPNLLSLIGVAMDQQYFYLVTEFMDGGSLADVVLHSAQNAKIQNYPEIIRIATEVAYGLHHLHSLKPRIIHRDLKPENILLTSSGGIKIGDFGLSKMILEYSEFMDSQGTAPYMAPESIKNGEYSEKTDIYSYGIILWQMYTEKPPYEDLTPFEIMFKVSNDGLRPVLPPASPKFFRDLYLDCIETNPEHRPTAKETIQRLENAPKSIPFNSK